MVASAAQVPAPLTIDEAVQLGTVNAFRVRSAEAQARQADATARQAVAALGPQLSLTSNFNWQDGIAGQPSQFGGSAVIESKTVVLALNQNIDLTGSTRAGVIAQRLFASAQWLQVTATVNQVRADIRKAYLHALQAEGLVVVQSLQLDTLTATLEETQQRYEQGAVPKFDILRLQNEVNRVRKDLVNAQSGLMLAKQTLNNAMGRPIETEFDLVQVGASDQEPGLSESYVTGTCSTKSGSSRSTGSISTRMSYSWPPSRNLVRSSPSYMVRRARPSVAVFSPSIASRSLRGMALSSGFPGLVLRSGVTTPGTEPVANPLRILSAVSRASSRSAALKPIWIGAAVPPNADPVRTVIVAPGILLTFSRTSPCTKTSERERKYS